VLVFAEFLIFHSTNNTQILKAMKKYILISAIAVLAMLNISASTNEQLANYENVKANILSKQSVFANAYLKENNIAKKDSIVLAASSFLEKTLVEDVFPQWYGTGWDFNGVSQIPKKGDIACGYFISTTLKQAGLQVDRCKLAQQGAMEICTSLSGKNNAVLNKGKTEIETINFIKANLKNGLYIMGFSNHVSFLHKKGKSINIIHSNYISDKVESDDFATSSILAWNNPVVFAPILPNKSFVINWLTKSSIKINLTKINK
jgi:branched-subunit amino acid transport protein AzlD